MFVELLLIALLVLACAWFYMSRRAGLKRQALQQLHAAEVSDAAGQWVFRGQDATVLHEDLGYTGSDQTGLYLQASYLCRMPDASVFRATVVSPSAHQAGRVDVVRLSPDDAAQALASHQVAD